MEEALEERSTEALEADITERAAHLDAFLARWLTLVGEFDAREGYGRWECASMAQFLNWRCGVALRTADDLRGLEWLFDEDSSFIADLHLTGDEGALLLAALRKVRRARVLRGAQLPRVLRGAQEWPCVLCRRADGHGRDGPHHRAQGR